MKITEKCQDFLRRGISFCLVPVFAVVMGGCSKSNEKPTFDSVPAVLRVDSVGTYDSLVPFREGKLSDLGVSNVSQSDLQYHDFDYIVDVEKLGIKYPYRKLQFFESFNLRSISSEKADEEAGLAEYIFRHNRALNPVSTYILGEEKLIIPDCYAHYFFDNSEYTFNETLKVFKRLKWFYSEKILINNQFGNPLKLVYSRAEVKEDIDDLSNNDLYTIDSLLLNPGDIMESYSLYVMSSDGENSKLVGYMQTGAGAHSENIQDKNFGDLSSIITSVSDSFPEDDYRNISPEEFVVLEEQISDLKIVDGIISGVGYSYSKK